MERLTRRGLMCFEEHPSTLPSPPGLQKCQVLKINPCISYKQEKEKGAPLFYWGADCTKDSICFGGHHPDLLWGSNFSISALLPPPPPYGSFATFPFVICVFLVLCFQFFFLSSFIHVLFFHIWHHVVSPLSPPLDVFIQRPLHKRKGNL